MAIGQGINKIVVAKKQSGLGVPATGSGGQTLRRESAVFNLEKQTYSNNEIVTHQQSTGITHGVRSTKLALNGVLSPLTYADFFASLLRKAFATGVSAASVSVTIAGSGPTYTVTRATGSYITDGFKLGDVIRLTVGALNANNINKNLLITALTATVATVIPVNGTALTAEGPITGTTVAVQGKKVWAPDTGHTREYWTIEEWFTDISQSGYFTDVMLGDVEVGLPSTGNATVAFNLAGLNATYSGSQVLTTPTAETTTPVLAAVNGVLVVNGASVGLITGASLKVDGGAAIVGAVVGANVSPDIQRSRLQVTGQLTVYFQDGVFRNYFDAATAVSAYLIVTNDSTKNSDFVSFIIPKLKFSASNIDDGEKGLVLTMPFTAEINGSGGTGTTTDKTILAIQDTMA